MFDAYSIFYFIDLYMENIGLLRFLVSKVMKILKAYLKITLSGSKKITIMISSYLIHSFLYYATKSFWNINISVINSASYIEIFV